MSDLNISSSTHGNMTDNVTDVTIDNQNTQGISEQEETEYINPNFTKWFGIYKTIPEVKIAIDMRAFWTLGDKIEADTIETEVILDHITGCGIDTFRNVLKNMLIICRVNGDAYAEIVRGEDGTLVNIKPLDPASIKVIFDRKGLIKRYEQVNKNSKRNEVVHTFKPNEIFHLCNKRVADEIHGVSDIEALENIINASNESFADMKKVMHRYVKPMMKFILDTDDAATIDAMVIKFDEAVNKGENLFIPKGSVEQELISVPANSTLNPIPWRDHLRSYFFQVIGIPQIILGNAADFGESSAKIAYLAFETSVKDEQQYITEQVWDQLFLRIKLKFPASLRNELLTDESKDANQGMEFQAGDTTAGVGK